jgi:hypothetical protein
MTITIDGQAIEIIPPIRITFECVKSSFGQANKLTAKIYNLASDKRGKLSFEPEDRLYVRITLSIGYGDNLLGIFRGNIWRAKSEKSGTDYITTIESIDGGQDYFYAYTSKTIEGGDIAASLLEDMPNTARGAILPMKTLIRPKVLVGSTSKLFDELLDENQSMYIDSEKLYVIDTSTFLGDKIPEVSAETGLMDTPERSKQIISFNSIINPLLRISNRCKLTSVVDPSLNGVYRIDTITYRGDNYGNDWNQACEARYTKGMTKL